MENNMYPPKVIGKIDICFCCKRKKEGTIIDNRHVCHNCNHLKPKSEKNNE